MDDDANDGKDVSEYVRGLLDESAMASSLLASGVRGVKSEVAARLEFKVAGAIFPLANTLVEIFLNLFLTIDFTHRAIILVQVLCSSLQPPSHKVKAASAINKSTATRAGADEILITSLANDV